MIRRPSTRRLAVLASPRQFACRPVGEPNSGMVRVGAVNLPRRSRLSAAGIIAIRREAVAWAIDTTEFTS